MPEVNNRGKWNKGQSGNPKGRPPRALTDTLQMMTEFDSYDDMPNKRLLAQLLWEGLTCGQISMVGGKTLELKGKEWVELVKWFYTHLDGTYRAREREDQATAEEEPGRVRIMYGSRKAESPQPLSLMERGEKADSTVGNSGMETAEQGLKEEPHHQPLSKMERGEKQAVEVTPTPFVQPVKLTEDEVTPEQYWEMYQAAVALSNPPGLRDYD